jgi:hypothetical protein
MTGRSIGSHTGPTASDAPPKPVSPSERIDAIDVLRGLALFGVLAMNIVTVFRVSIFAQFLPDAEPAGPLNQAVSAVLTIAVDFQGACAVLPPIRRRPRYPIRAACRECKAHDLAGAQTGRVAGDRCRPS